MPQGGVAGDDMTYAPLLTVVLVPLIQEMAATYREHLRQKRKAAKDQQNVRIAQLEQRLAQLELQAAAEARWRP